MDRLQRLVHEKRCLKVTYTNKFAWTVLPDGAWEDKTCFIVGGGPSLANFNWDLLKGKLTIAINRAYEKFEPTIIFGMDPSFVRWVLMGKYGDLARTKFLQSSAMKIWVNTSGIDLPDDIYILKCWRNYLEGRRAFPLTMKEGIGHGNNSGYGALNLAACLGANPIYLLGYDMKRVDGRRHWHDGHPKQPPEHVPDSFKEHFPAAAQILKRNEITVINLNPDSALDCFPKMKMSTGFNAPLKPKSEEGEHAKDKPFIPAIKTASPDAIMDNAWKGHRCFIIGGGASLSKFNFSTLRDELTIGVNRAYEQLDCTIMFATDGKLHKWITEGRLGAKAKERFEEFKGHKIWLDSANHAFKGIQHLRAIDGKGLSSSLQTGLKSGGNSGYGALNLAICLGANPIYLLGFDMKGIDGKQAHWHDGYPKAQPDKVYKKFKTCFESVAPLLKRKGIKVINLNPKSDLKCFEFGKFEDLVRDTVMKSAMREDSTGRYHYIEIYDSKKVMPRSKKNLLFEGCLGFGDNFYQRPIIKDVAQHFETIYLDTAFPEVYWDIPNVKFVYPRRINLRTQRKHIDSLPKETWSPKPPKDTHPVWWGHICPPADAHIQTRYVELENREDFDFSFPLKEEWIKAAKKVVRGLQLNGKKLCIIRRPTLRREWNCPARNPKIEYYQLLIDRYKDEYFFLGLADVKGKEEWFDGDLHGLDKEFNEGEIPLTTILGLMKLADMTITYPSFFMIACVAIRARCFTIYGGIAAPHYSLRKRLGLQNFAVVAPEPMCSCHTMTHKCNKNIPSERIIAGFEELKHRGKPLKTVSVGVPPGLGDSYWVMAHMESFKRNNAIDKLKIVVMNGGKHDYTAPVLRLFPFVDEVVEQPAVFRLEGLYNKNAPKFMEKNTQGVDYFIDFGALMWLKGMKLEEIYPQCTTNFDCYKGWNLPKDAQVWAANVRKQNKGKLVLFYASSIMSNNHWNGGAWDPEDWVSMADRIFYHAGIRPILIGAEWDKDYATKIRKLDTENNIQDRVGTTSIYQILSLIKEARLMIGFPSGIPMMATYFGVPTVMFWGVHGTSRRARFDSEFLHAWVSPKMRASGRYYPAIYDNPETNAAFIFNRIRGYL